MRTLFVLTVLACAVSLSYQQNDTTTTTAAADTTATTAAADTTATTTAADTTATTTAAASATTTTAAAAATTTTTAAPAAGSTTTVTPAVQCQNNCSKVNRPVCGSINGVQRTFRNLCNLRARRRCARLNGRTTIVKNLHSGACT